jgi:hypothetical protein
LRPSSIGGFQHNLRFLFAATRIAATMDSLPKQSRATVGIRRLQMRSNGGSHRKQHTDIGQQEPSVATELAAKRIPKI